MRTVLSNGWLYNANLFKKQFNNPSFGRTVTANATLTKTDSGTTIVGNSASAITFTIPNDTTVKWKDMEIVNVYQKGAGAVSFVAGSGVTLRSPAGVPAAVQYGFITVIRVGANEWTLA